MYVKLLINLAYHYYNEIKLRTIINFPNLIIDVILLIFKLFII